MAEAQRTSPRSQCATPASQTAVSTRETGDNSLPTSAVVEGSDKVVGSMDPSRGDAGGISASNADQEDAMSMYDASEESTLRRWSSEQGNVDKDDASNSRKRRRNVPVDSPKVKRSKKSVSSRSESESSDSSSTSKSDQDSSDNLSDTETSRPFKPKLKNKKVVSTKVPKHVKKYIERYAIKGLKTQVRQGVTNNWPIHESKRLRPLSVDIFFRKHFFKGSKWNQKLEKAKINAQLSVLWTEAEHIRDNGQGMDPADVIQLVQRAIVLIGNAHFIFINERRKAIMATSMPENMDMLSEKEGLRALSESKRDLFGKSFLKLLAKDSKDNKELKDLLVKHSPKSGHKKGGFKRFNFRNDQFFQKQLPNNLQSGSQNPVLGQPRRNFGQGYQIKRRQENNHQYQSNVGGHKKPNQ